MFFKIGVLKNFAKLTGKDLYWILLSKDAELRVFNFVKRDYIRGVSL